MNTIKALLEKARTDADLSRQLRELATKQDPEAITVFLKAQGIPEEEIRKALAQTPKFRTAASEHLSEEELSQVAGGWCPWLSCNPYNCDEM